MIKVFTNDWYKKPIVQNSLLAAVNNPIPKFRENIRGKLRLDHIDSSFKIARVKKDCVIYRLDKENYKFVGKSRNPFAKDLEREYRKIWETLHRVDCRYERLKGIFRLPELSFGFPTYTGNPDAHPETNTVDGHVTHNHNATGLPWAGIRDDPGSDSGHDGTTINCADLATHPDTNEYRWMTRGIHLYNTAELTGDATIGSSTWSGYGSAKSNTFVSLLLSLALCGSNPNTNTTLIATDYGTLGNTDFGTTQIAYAAFDAAGWNVITLNTAGKTAISKTGITKLGLRDGINDLPDSEPTWEDDLRAYMLVKSADNGSLEPLLTIEYSLPGGNAGFGGAYGGVPTY